MKTSTIQLIQLLAVLAIILTGSMVAGSRYRRHCDPENPDFIQRHAFMLGRFTANIEETFWIQNATFMSIGDIREDTYRDYVKIVAGQKNWYDAENCRFVSDQAWPAGPGLWRMARIYSYIESPGAANGQGNSRSIFPKYEIVFSAEHLLYDHRSAVYLDFISQVIGNNEAINYAIVPGQNLVVFDEAVKTIRPHEHAYYSNNYEPTSLTALPDWAWFHSHADIDPASDFNLELAPCFNGLNDGTLPVMQDPLANEPWLINVCVTGGNAARDDDGQIHTPVRNVKTETVDGIQVSVVDFPRLTDTFLGRFTEEHIDELQNLI